MVAFGDVGQVRDRVEVTGVDLAGIADDDSRLAQLGQLPVQCRQVDSADGIGRAYLNRIPPMAEHLKGLTGAGMHVSARENRHPPAYRCQPLSRHIDAMLLAPPVGVAHASPVKLANVALLTSAPPQVPGSPTSSRSHCSATSSTADANSDETREKAF